MENRIQSFNTEISQQQAAIEAANQREQVAAWSARMALIREQQWIAAQILLGVAQCYLENFGDEQLQKMTLSQATTALVIASKIARMAIAGCGVPHEAEYAPAPNQTTPEDIVTMSSDKPAELPQPTQSEICNSESAMEEPSLSAMPLAINCEKIFSAAESAEKCRSVSQSEIRPANPVSLSPTAIDVQPRFSGARRSALVSPLPLCPSQGSRRTQSFFHPYKVPKSAVRCRSANYTPFHIPAAWLTTSAGRRVSAVERDTVTRIPPNDNFTQRLQVATKL